MGYHWSYADSSVGHQCPQRVTTRQHSGDSSNHCSHRMALGHGGYQCAMPSTLTIFFSALLFTVLGIGWIKGYDIVKAKAPAMLAKFYLAYAVFRMITVLLFVGVYILFISDGLAQSKAFVVMVFIMYAIMMTVTLKLKH